MAARLLPFRRPEKAGLAAPSPGPSAGEGAAVVPVRPTPRPILPAWAHDRSQARDAAKWAAKHSAHTAAFHGIRAPKYAARFGVYAPRGAWRASVSAVRWLLDVDGLQVQRHTIASLASAALGPERSSHTNTYRSLAKEHAHRVKTRLFLVGAALVL